MTIAPTRRGRPNQAHCQHRTEVELSRQSRQDTRDPRVLLSCEGCRRTRVVRLAELPAR